jgi:hypothetical protein
MDTNFAIVRPNLYYLKQGSHCETCISVFFVIILRLLWTHSLLNITEMFRARRKVVSLTKCAMRVSYFITEVSHIETDISM